MRAKLVATGAVLGHHSASLALAVVRVEGRGPERRRQAALGPSEAVAARARGARQQGGSRAVWGSGWMGFVLCVLVCMKVLACISVAAAWGVAMYVAAACGAAVCGAAACVAGAMAVG